MGHKYYIPENHSNLAACEGFYIENKVFFGADAPAEIQWDGAIQAFITKFKRFSPALQVVNNWENKMGIRRYILMKNRHMQLILGEDEEYASLFLIIPEEVDNGSEAKRGFDVMLDTLRNFLVRKYPGSVYRRKNTWNLEPVTIDQKRKRRILS